MSILKGCVAAFALMGLASVAHADAAPMPFDIQMDSPTAQVGKPTTVKVKVKASAGYHMNKEFPTSLTLAPPASMTVAKVKLTTTDVKLDEHSAEFTVSFTSTAAGHAELPGDLKFAVCTAESCYPQKAKIGIQVTTK